MNSEEGFSRVENGPEVQLCRFLRQNNDLIGFGALFDWAHDIEKDFLLKYYLLPRRVEDDQLTGHR